MIVLLLFLLTTPPSFQGGGWGVVSNIDRQFWGTNVNPSIGTGSDPCHWNIFDTAQVNAQYVTYTVPTEVRDSLITIPFFVDCGSSREETKKKKDQPQSILDTISCQGLFNEALSYEDNQMWQMCFDTSKYFIEQCPFNFYAPGTFGVASNALSQMPGQPQQELPFRQWLESVLYLNTVNPEYFCADVEQIGGTFSYFGNDWDSELAVTNEGLAVTKWLIDSGGCNTSELQGEFDQGRSNEYQAWLLDTTRPYDTTLPSMHDLGLDSILSRQAQYLGVNPPQRFQVVVPEFSVSENPFTKTTDLRFTLSELAYLTIQTFDVTGRPVFGNDMRQAYGSGDHTVPIDLTNLAAGTYYLRIALGMGEVKTVKLVKE